MFSFGQEDFWGFIDVIYNIESSSTSKMILEMLDFQGYLHFQEIAMINAGDPAFVGIFFPQLW
jgi:hypothetical protein